MDKGGVSVRGAAPQINYLTRNGNYNGRRSDPARIKSLCDEINANGIDIRGSLPALAVCAYDGAKITDLAAFSCEGQKLLP